MVWGSMPFHWYHFMGTETVCSERKSKWWSWGLAQVFRGSGYQCLLLKSQCNYVWDHIFAHSEADLILKRGVSFYWKWKVCRIFLDFWLPFSIYSSNSSNKFKYSSNKFSWGGFSDCFPTTEWSTLLPQFWKDRKDWALKFIKIQFLGEWGTKNMETWSL